jgi:hypothetical protein
MIQRRAFDTSATADRPVRPAGAGRAQSRPVPQRVSLWSRRLLAIAASVLTVTGLFTALATTSSAAPIAAGVNNPPTGTRSILVFPQRDFVSASGYAATDQVVVYLIHPNGTTWSTDPNAPITPADDPRAAPGAPFAGIVEVNHPGGACWFGTTPDIRPGDVVQIDIVGGPNAGQADATTVSNITVQRPVQTGAGTVVVHGTAVATDGVSQLPVAQLEQRMVANRDAFDANGRRTLRATSAAGADGTLSYDAAGSTNWTATYTGLDAADVTRTLGAEARVLWLGAAVAPALESTIYENGAAVTPGPALPGCTAPLEKLPPPPGSELVPPSDVTNLTATLVGTNTVRLNWDAATDNVGVTSYGIYRDGVALFNVQNPDGSAPAPVTFTDKNVPPGTYIYTVDAADAVGNRSVNQSNGATVTTTAQVATLPAGTVVNDPPVAPVQIISFPSRDFISSSGFDEADTVDVQLLRKVDGTPGLTVIGSADGVIPQADPRAAPGDPFAGIVEVNHPGGANWDGPTPDIRTGDIVRTIAYRFAADGSQQIRTVDQTKTANVTVTRLGVTATAESQPGASDGSVRVHGVAMQADGSPIPLGQFEERMIANRDAFALNGRRTIRAGGAGRDGTLTYDANDPTGTHWTAVYSGLVQQDVDRIMGTAGFPGAEFRALWLGSQPLAGLELTIFENGGLIANGPSIPPCTATCTAEVPDSTRPSVPSTLTATVPSGSPRNVDLRWGASTDNVAVYGYGIYRDGIRIANLDASVTSYTDTSVSPGPHGYTVDAVDAASPDAGAPSGQNKEWGNRSFKVDPPVTATVTDTTPPSVPADLAATVGVGSVSLAWSASTDDVGVVGYGVYRGGVKIADVTAATYSDTGLALGSYAYSVDAVDAAGNRSVRSPVVNAVVTAVPDVTAPSVPTGVTAATTPDIHGRDVTVAWAASTDDTAVAGYSVYRNGVKVATVNDVTLAYVDRNPGTGTYAYTVDAFDSAGNRSAQSAPAATAVVANDPPVAPHSLIAFPARDFISATGYTPGATYTFSLIRVGQTYTSASFQADATGLIEVNHPGGTCWNVNTPDMRPGDVIRITDANGVADQTTVANVTAERPIATAAGTVVIHGTAADANGNPIPVDQLDQRLIANRDAFDRNGRRTLRAGAAGDGTLTYDAPGSIRWTATYTGLSSNDVVRAVGGTTTSAGNVPVGTVFTGSESRILWLGRAPLALTETTIFENGPGVLGGPSNPPCTAPAETPVAAVSFTPASVAFANTQFLPAPVATSAASTVTFSNGGGAPMRITNIYLAGLNPGDFARAGGSCPTAFPAVLANGASCTVTVTFKPTALGLRQASVSFTDNAANTTDQSVALTGTGVDNTNPTISVNPTSFNFGTVNGGSTASRVFTVTNSGTDVSGRPLSVASVGVTGANAADFTVTGQTCTNNPLAQGVVPPSSCTVTVAFKPGARTARSATLTLTHNAAPVVTTTSIPLSGTGGTGSVLSFASNPVNFGTVTRNTSKDQTISVKNSGNAAATLNLASFAVTGTGYSKVSTTCGTLAANGSCNVVIRFTAPNTVGSFPGTVSVTAANGLPTTVSANLTATTK